jgi:chemotaxis response regulator CheB
VDGDEMVDVLIMDGVTAGMNEVKITEAAIKEEAPEVVMMVITRQVDDARDMDSMNQDEVDVAEKKNREAMTRWDENQRTPMEAKLLVAKKTKRNKWGLVLPVRQSERISRDGKSVLERATSRLEIKNLEKPAGKTSKLLKHSFSSIPASTLVEKENLINVSLGE